jgi:hypothetical protein
MPPVAARPQSERSPSSPAPPASMAPLADQSPLTLYRTAGIAALCAAVLTVASITAYITWPPPEGGATAWFELYDRNPLLGMVSLDLPYIVIDLLMLPVMLALYQALRRTRPTAALLAISLFGVTLAALLASNPMVEMLTLSREYATATTAAQQTALAGAGEAMLAGYAGTAFHLFYIGAQIAGILFGFAMLRSALFTRPIAVTMIAGNAVGFGLYLPAIGLALSVFSGVVLLLWMVLIGRRFLLLARPEA